MKKEKSFGKREKKQNEIKYFQIHIRTFRYSKTDI